MEIWGRYQGYFCYYGPESNGFCLDPIQNAVIINPKYADYCYPSKKTPFVILIHHYIPFLGAFPSFSFVITNLGALAFALAWSTIPTNVVIAAWAQMWNNSSTSS